MRTIRGEHRSKKQNQFVLHSDCAEIEEKANINFVVMMNVLFSPKHHLSSGRPSINTSKSDVSRFSV